MTPILDLFDYLVNLYFINRTLHIAENPHKEIIVIDEIDKMNPDISSSGIDSDLDISVIDIQAQYIIHLR